MHPHIIAAVCQTASCTNSWKYATSSWSTGAVVLGLIILGLVLAAAFGTARKVTR